MKSIEAIHVVFGFDLPQSALLNGPLFNSFGAPQPVLASREFSPILLRKLAPARSEWTACQGKRPYCTMLHVSHQGGCVA